MAGDECCYFFNSLVEDTFSVSRFSSQALKGDKGQDCEVYAPAGISVTTDDGKVIGRYCNSIIYTWLNFTRYDSY